MNNIIKKLKLSKRKYIYTVMACLIIIAIGATLAWWRWSSSTNAEVYGSVCAPEIIFVGGTTINGTDLLPVRTKEEGLTKDINVNLNNTCDNDTAVLNLNLKLDYFPSGLSDASFKWELYEVTTEEVNEETVETLTSVSSGNFANKVQADVISLATDLIVTSNVSTYRLFIWVDGAMDNPSVMGDALFNFKLYGTGTGAIYSQYTMATKSSGSATGAFWGSSINSNQVKSITFTSISNKPSTVDGQLDISSTANSGNILMWWIENGQTEGATPITLYDVYVANTHGGNVKANTNAERMFANLTNCESIDLTYLDTSNTTSFNRMFEYDAKLTQINLSNLNTSNNTYMAYMFSCCSKLTSLDLSSFDTRKVTSMRGMFMNCSSLTSLDLSNFYTPLLNTVSDGTQYGMFQGCTNLVTLNLKNFNTSRISDFRVMFKNCSKLKRLDLSDFDTSNATYLSGSSANSMFNGCTSLEYLDVSNFSNGNVTSINGLFYGLSALKTLILTNFNTSKVTSFDDLFYNCSNLVSVDVSSFDTSKATTFTNMFRGCSKLKTIDLSNFITNNVTSLSAMFFGCSALTTPILSSFDTTKVTDMYAMFCGCSSLVSLDLSNFVAPNLSVVRGSQYSMFKNCSSLTDLNLSGLSLANVSDVSYMFHGCTSLKNLDLSGAIFSNISTMTSTFYNVPAFAKIYIDCSQKDIFINKFGDRDGLTTVNNESCNA